MMASLICYRSASHGRVPEVLRGNSFRSGGITRHQCWSETAVTGPAIQGMVGFSCNAIDNTVVIAPRMPFDWAFAKVGNLACGKAKLGLDMTRTEGNVKYVLSSTGAVTVDFKPAFAPGTVVNSVMVNGRETEFEVCSEKEYLSISCPVSLNGESVVEISYDEGVSSLPRYVVAEDNALSTGVRVLGQTLVNGKLTVNVQGKPGTVANFPIYNKGNVESVEVSFAESGESVIELNL